MLKFILVIMMAVATYSSDQIIEVEKGSCSKSSGNDCDKPHIKPFTHDKDTMKWMLETPKLFDFSKLTDKFKPTTAMIDDLVEQVEDTMRSVNLVCISKADIAKVKAVSYIQGESVKRGVFYLVKARMGKIDHVYLDIFRWNDGRASLLLISIGNCMDTFMVKDPKGKLLKLPIRD